VSDAGLSTADKDARIAELEAALAAAHADISARDILIDTLRVQIARLKRMQFGKSSEKLDTQIAQLELALEELEGEAIVAAARRADPADGVRSAPVRALPAHLPREEQRIEPEQGNCACPDCGGVLRPLGQDSDEVLDAVPVQWRVVRTIRPKYSCRACEKIVQAPAPVKAIARGKATFGTLAHVVVSKFDHHLPLYRQAEIMAAQGIENLRYATCACCATRWNEVRIKCLCCGSNKAISYRAAESDEAAVRAEVCSECRSWVKIFYLARNHSLDAIADDVGSLGLDLLMKETDFSRGGINPYLAGY